jgi:hypothetical protein
VYILPMRLSTVFSSWPDRGGNGAPVRESTFAICRRPRWNMPVFSDFSFEDVGVCCEGVWLTTVWRGMSVERSMLSPRPLSGWNPCDDRFDVIGIGDVVGGRSRRRWQSERRW